MEMVVDTPGKDGFEHLAEHGGEADRTVGGDVCGRFLGLGEEYDAGGLPQVRIETSGKDDIIQGHQGSQERDGAFTKVTIGNPVVTGGGVSFGAKDLCDIWYGQWRVKWRGGETIQVLEAGSKRGG